MAGETRQKIFKFVQQEILDGHPPTIREVQEQFNFKSSATAREHIDKLIDLGLLMKNPKKSRGLALPGLKPVGSIQNIPILGRVAAGPFDLAMQETIGYVPLARRGDEENFFALKVNGESMRDKGILPGDILIVRRQNQAINNDIVVALVGDEATVKTFKLHQKAVELKPANSDYSSMFVEPEALIILGKVVEVRRHIEGGPYYS